MKNINTGAKVEEYNIDGKIVLRFNPADATFVKNFNAAFKALAEAQSELAEAAKNADDEAFFDASAATNTKLRGVLNDLFGEDICTPIWGTMDLTAISDGLPLWFNFMMALIDEIDVDMKNIKAVRSARLDKYTAKYVKKSEEK